MHTFHPCLAAFLSLALACQASLAQAAKGKDDVKGKDELETIQINDQLTNFDPADLKTNNHHKVHVVKLLAAKTYQITLTRRDDKQAFSPYLRLEDSTGKELQALNSFKKVRIIFTPPKDDTYKFVVSSVGGVGEYVLTVSPSTKVLVLKDHDPAKVIDAGKAGFEVSSKITDKDARDKSRANMFAKVYLVKMVKNKSYSIEMISRQFDSYLRLEDAAGKGLAEDDDSGGNLDALIVFRAPETGTYRVIATTFAPNAQGEFLLRVQEE